MILFLDLIALKKNKIKVSTTKILEFVYKLGRF